MNKKDEMIELISKDNLTLKVPKQFILMSQLIKDMLEEDDEDEEVKIPIPNVDSKALAKVIEYCKEHYNNRAHEIEKPLKGNLEDVISSWDNEFLNVEQSLLIELVMAANYLNLKDLLDLVCAKVASLIKGKKPEQIREMFGIENDFTPQEEENIREENKWCEDF